MTITIHDIERHIQWRIVELEATQKWSQVGAMRGMAQAELRKLLDWIEKEVDKAAREEV